MKMVKEVTNPHYLGPGCVISRNSPEGSKFVVTDTITRSGEDWRIQSRRLNEDGTDDIGNDTVSFTFFSTPGFESVYLHDRMVRRSHGNVPFEKVPAEGLGEYTGDQYSHSKVLSKNNPLRHMKYWNSPGGKNLTIIDCLEWALTHLRHCEEELPCDENSDAIIRIEQAIEVMKIRHSLRVKQGLLGTDKPHKSSPGSVSD